MYEIIFVLLSSVDALQLIATEMGATYWRFNGDLCEVDSVGVSPTPPSGSEGYVECNCNYNNNTVCHVTKMYIFILLSFLCCSMVYLEFNGLSSGSIYLSVLKSYNLPGILPLNIVKLAYLQDM